AAAAGVRADDLVGIAVLRSLRGGAGHVGLGAFGRSAAGGGGHAAGRHDRDGDFYGPGLFPLGPAGVVARSSLPLLGRRVTAPARKYRETRVVRARLAVV